MFSDTLAAANAVIQPHIARIQLLIDYCPAHPIATPGCHDFWMVSILGPIALIAVILTWFLVNAIKDQQAMKRLEKMKADQLIVADKETLDKHKWKGLDDTTETADEAELAERIRQAIKKPVSE